MSRVRKGCSVIFGLALVANACHGDPLAEWSADLCVGILHVHYIGTLLAHGVQMRANREVYRFTCDGGGDEKALGDIAVFGLSEQSAIGVCLGASEGHALADLNLCGDTFSGLDLLNAAFTAGGADHAGV